MGAKALLTTVEVAETLGVSPRHAQRIAPASLVRDGRVLRREYHVSSLPADAQLEWSRRNNVVQLTPATAPGQMALSLAVPVGPNLSEEDRIVVEQRYKVIEPLLKPDQFRAI